MKFQEGTNERLTGKVKDWWNQNPFTYLMDNKAVDSNWAFFRNIDRKIIKWMPWAQKGYPLLSSVITYPALKGKKVLDIAVGTGWSTEQFVRAGAEVTAIDLTPTAVEITKKRLALYGLSATVLTADAQNLPFPDASFDFVLAFGCLMHMPDTQKAINEIHRVLKPGGTAAAMMYYKHSLHFWYYIFLGKGILRGKLLSMGIQELSNRYTDGAYEEGNQLTKFYSKKEVRSLFSKFKDTRIRICDAMTPIDHLPHRFLPLGTLIPPPIKRWLTTKVGQTLWIEAHK
jgi:ubiquinone/menaquinone biosynthesis C-methylase UbiE